MTDTPNTHDQAAETMTAETALEHLVVFTAMEDAQLATDCERVIKAALSSERTARQEAEARAEAAERERDELRLDITGGEDAPGYNASLSHQTIRDILAENYRSWWDSSDRYVTASDQLAEAREALEFYADPATYHACSFLFDRPTGGFDEDFSDDHGDPDYGRPMPGKLARAALAPHPEKEEADHA